MHFGNAAGQPSKEGRKVLLKGEERIEVNPQPFMTVNSQLVIRQLLAVHAGIVKRISLCAQCLITANAVVPILPDWGVSPQEPANHHGAKLHSCTCSRPGRVSCGSTDSLALGVNQRLRASCQELGTLIVSNMETKFTFADDSPCKALLYLLQICASSSLQRINHPTRFT